MNTLYLNKISYNTIKKFPVKLQIFFILKFSPLIFKEEMDCLASIIKKYNKDSDSSENEIILSILSTHNYEVLGTIVNSKVSWSLLKKDYNNMWLNLIDSCMCRKNNYFGGLFHDIPFDIILLMCETFDIAIEPHQIPKLMKLPGYTEDNAIYMIRSKTIKFKYLNNFDNLMKVIESMYDNAINRNYNILAKVIKTIPNFVGSLNENKILELISETPEVLEYNLYKGPITLDLLRSSNDVLSLRLKYLSYDGNYPEFQLSNKIMYVILANKLDLPLNANYNDVFYNYVNKIKQELDLECSAYNDETNYCTELIKLHIEMLSKPIYLNKYNS